MRYIFSIVGIVMSFLLVVYRQQVGDTIGEAEWMQKIGGVYNFVILFALFLFFWSLATITGTTEILFRPLLMFLPGYNPPQPPVTF